MEADSALADAVPLEQELQDLRNQAIALRKELQIQCSTILASSMGIRAAAAASSSSSSSSSASTDLATRASHQRAYMQRSNYRASAPVTAFKVQDPDPCAVDGGKVLGLRFEAMSRGQFHRPYYVMLNRPYDHSPRHLKLHRHTLPPTVAVNALAARYLPHPSGGQQQHLERFVAELRRDIVRYHNRMGVAADLRRKLGLHHRRASSANHSVVEVVIADIEAKHVKIGWADGRSGRLVLDHDGCVRNLVVFDHQGRDWDTAVQLMGSGKDGLQDLAARLQPRDVDRPGKRHSA
ncbi:hypothetical protein L249_3945 [Ophiocordyceps polyrhachis-furcata BCC 54312]|uniref:Cenp-O kinetochore centromere component n=1 Tax=Ophiocordyceps polyrhachis-furcata BCC 54312 TaxID=1330021 RepID=A0A367L527_9HYPO|nr:hypothetical protein L249_3945 [Ophiocordyceps polyrhachis-furcata BCC 54312]